MDILTPRDRLLERLDDLSDTQIEALISYSETFETDAQVDEPVSDDDPMIGMFSGPTDLSVHAKQILREDIDTRSGWTQKRDE